MSAHLTKIRENHSRIGALRILEVAQDLLVSESMVRKLIATGELRAGSIGKRKIIFQEDLEAFKTKLRGVGENGNG
ncbi:MAG: helix-turn-helix domain-containing protein [Spirochaetia bacterium]|jgi:excisionase family DNA binding protein